jgi:uncharacterized protein with GYD domain
MEYYLLRISYTAAGWREILLKGPSFDQRMEPVRKLIAQMRGSFASFHFYDTPAFQKVGTAHSVKDKFAVFGGQDLMAVVAMPDRMAGQALALALSSQPGIKDVDLQAMVPFEEVITGALPAANAAVGATRYLGPGSSTP